MNKQQLKDLIKEEIKNVLQETKNQSLLKEDLALAGDIALGVAGGLAGLWALVKGVPYVIQKFGSAAGQLALAAEQAAAASKAKARREGYAEVIDGIASRLGSDSILMGMYNALPEEAGPERTKQLKQIATYIKSKLDPKEMKYFADVSSKLRTGDLTHSGKFKEKF